MNTGPSVAIYNGQSVGTGDIPVAGVEEFRTFVIEAAAAGLGLASLFAVPSRPGRFRLYAVLAADETGRLYVSSTEVPDEYPSITPDCPQAHLFEREVAEQWAIVPRGHPWLKPVRFHRSSVPGRDAFGRSEGRPILPSVMDFFQVEGEQIHEVAVGPVHAGIIEPGHFRFQCHGEEVLHLEISLGYQHRGIERALIGGPGVRTLHFIENVAGDAAVGHATAYGQMLESLSGVPAAPRAQSLRGIALELERLANHTGDLGALAGDVGYLPTSSFCGRIRGDFLNMTASLCGNRFGRGVVAPGGVHDDLTEEDRGALSEKLARAGKDVSVAVKLLWSTPSVLARFEETGVLTADQCRTLGLAGVPARACGLETDIRFNFPSGIYRFSQMPVSTWPSGDVFARAYVRWLEIQRSIAFILEQLRTCPPGPVRVEVKAPAADRFCVSLVEGWRGRICHVGITDSGGRFSRYKIVDPSFLNWTGLALAMRNQPVSDFPLCNKSFNLSYCGHDL